MKSVISYVALTWSITITASLAIAQPDLADLNRYLRDDSKIPAGTKLAWLDSFLTAYPATPKRAHIQLEMARANEKLGKIAHAKEIYMRLLEHDTIEIAMTGDNRSKYGIVGLNSRAYAYEYLGGLYLRQKEVENAALNYRHALRTSLRSNSGTDINAFEVRVSSKLADCYMKLGHQDSAIAVLLPFMFNPVLYSQQAARLAVTIIRDRKDKASWCSVFKGSLSRSIVTDSTVHLELNGVQVTIPLIVWPEVSNKSNLLTSPLARKPLSNQQLIEDVSRHPFIREACKE